MRDEFLKSPIESIGKIESIESIMKVSVGVFFGGKSVEHEVSVISALQAIAALDSSRYQVVPVYVTKKGAWYTGEALLAVENYKDMDKLLRAAVPVYWKSGAAEAGFWLHPAQSGWLQKPKPIQIDVVLPVLHGTFGEDGCIQGLFELADVPYAGCDVLSSANGMDKIATKALLQAAGIPVIGYTWFNFKSWAGGDASVREEVKRLGFPLIVKPANLGSSVGISKAKNEAELEEAVALAGSFAQRVIVEKMVQDLREINCSVVGDYEHAEASVCEEPMRQGDFLSYADKYLSAEGGGKQKGGSGSKGMASTKRKIPADLSPEQAAKVQQLAKDTFRTLGCSGVSRIDFLMDNADGELYVNEINTIPGSLSFYLWEPANKPFGRLLDEMIDTAFKAHREKQQLVFTYDTNIFTAVNIGKAGKK
jgi:D-alanine-D-alanine ligase